MKAIELGGGGHPQIHPNLDCRAILGVDIIADFEKTLPLSSNEFDLVFSQFALEHISWRKVPDFIKEIHRILKPTGKALIVTADLRAQCQYILKKPEWTFAEVETIFGSQDFGENAHKSSMSQELAMKVFRDAGFNNVQVFQVGICATDMLIQAIK